jgi:hypothetical protein
VREAGADAVLGAVPALDREVHVGPTRARLFVDLELDQLVIVGDEPRLLCRPQVLVGDDTEAAAADDRMDVSPLDAVELVDVRIVAQVDVDGT